MSFTKISAVKYTGDGFYLWCSKNFLKIHCKNSTETYFPEASKALVNVKNQDLTLNVKYLKTAENKTKSKCMIKYH